MNLRQRLTFRFWWVPLYAVYVFAHLGIALVVPTCGWDFVCTDVAPEDDPTLTVLRAECRMMSVLGLMDEALCLGPVK